MQYQSCNIILDASIGNDKNSVYIWEGIIKYLIKSMKISILDFCVFTVHCMKREIIREIIYQLKSRWKFFIKFIKGLKNFI